MIRTDERGNLYTFIGNSATFKLQDLPEKKGSLVCGFCGDIEVRKEYELNNQKEAIIKLTKQDIESIGVGSHPYYIDIISDDGEDVDTIVYQQIYVFEKE